MVDSMLAARPGNGGWSRVWHEASGLPGAIYVRVAEVDGALRVTELYFDGRGEAITAEALRAFPLNRIAQLGQQHGEKLVDDVSSIFALVGMSRDDVAGGLAPGPNLSLLAAHYATQARDAEGWVRGALEAQEPENLKDNPPMPEEPDPHELELGDEALSVPDLQRPAGRDLPDEFLRQVVRAHDIAIRLNQSPAKAIARHTTPRVKPGTVQSWFLKARARGLMAPAAAKGRIV